VNLLTSMLESREQWLGHLINARMGSGFDRHGLENSLRYLIEIQLRAARDATPVPVVLTVNFSIYPPPQMHLCTGKP